MLECVSQQGQHYLILNRNSMVWHRNERGRIFSVGFKVKSPKSLAHSYWRLLPLQKFLMLLPWRGVPLNAFSLCPGIKTHPPRSTLRFACHDFVVRGCGEGRASKHLSSHRTRNLLREDWKCHFNWIPSSFKPYWDMTGRKLLEKLCPVSCLASAAWLHTTESSRI